VKRLAIATLVVTIARVAHADTSTTPARPADKPTKPDEIADVESSEANLESSEPRKGLTFAGALGGGLMIGGGVGRGPTLSLRLGHVATRKTVITFELTFGNALHKESTTGATLTDINTGLFAGAQRYKARRSPLWGRIAGGPMVLVKNAMADGSGGGDKPITGIGGLLGGGYDIARWGYLVFGAELTGIASLSRDGLKVQGGLGLGLSYY